jgi:ABC-type nitrate/sulfonate/bicarbonate transport system substrate-binding protein
MDRRDFLTLGASSIASASFLSTWNNAHAQSSSSFTQWGWPQPYQRISDESIKWLKNKDWWPLAIGNQPGFTSLPAAVGKGFFKERGLEIVVNAFLSGPAINEAAVASRVQAGIEGNFPFTTLLARSFPVRCVAIGAPNIKHATLVPLDSPLKSLADIKKLQEKPSFGIVAGSSAEFYFPEALRIHGLDSAKDVVLKNMKPTDMLIMPSGLTGFVQWHPYIWDHVLVRKNARQIDSIYSYNFYMGNVWVRQELIENTPDVVQALVDAYAEGILYTQADVAGANKVFQEDPMYRGFPPEIINLLNEKVNNIYKPHWFYPDAGFWSAENSRVAAWLHQTGRLPSLVTQQMYHDNFEPRFATQTIAKLGWKVPSRPSFIPADWKGKVGSPPYPEYYNEDTLAKPQVFPEAGELQKDWMFGGKLYRA